MNPKGSLTAAAEDPPQPSGASPDPDPGQAGSAATDASGGPEAGKDPADGARVEMVYRTQAGWRVGNDDLPDLVNAMVFADLLAGELPSSARPRADGPPASDTAETARLRTTIAQLEHALAHRVRVEQAIGVLAERHRLQPRKAFELLRSAARSRGRRVQELAEEVVANITNPLLPIPEELARPLKTAHRRGRSDRG